MKIQYRPAAIDDLRQMAEYLTTQLKNPTAAVRLKTKLLHSISNLKDYPNLGAKLENTDVDIRYLIVEHQLVFYMVKERKIDIIRILDGRTDYLARLFSELN